MSWAVGFDSRWKRWIGYGVPATCDYPGCGEEIDRGLAYVCADEEPYGGERGCGLFFCGKHSGAGGQCERCAADEPPFDATSDVAEWTRHMLTDASWENWRKQHPDEVARLLESPQAADAVDPHAEASGKPTTRD